MTPRIRRLAQLALVATVLTSLSACTIRYRHEVEPPGTPAEYTYGQGGFIRYDGYMDVAGDLEIPVVTYTKPGSNVTLQFVGVVHIGDQDYYQQLQGILDAADLTLYEGVRRGGQPGDVDEGSRTMYGAIAGLLGLSGQLDAIDYHRDHWVQCDMITDAPPEGGTSLIPPGSREMVLMQLEQITQLKQTLGALLPLREMEDFSKHNYAVALSSQAEGMGLEGMGEQIEQLRAVLGMFKGSDERIDELDRMLAEMQENFANMETLIITERNIYVMDALTEEINAQQKHAEDRTIAVFYGAGHLADFHRRLRELGWKESDRTWYKAWKLNSAR